jgi:hypothetical protein
LSKREDYLWKLKPIDDWQPYLLKESGLPGRRANLELVQAVVDLGDERSKMDDAWVGEMKSR